jgi:RimJ/RimL family protein N-acetyltransferase
MEDKPILRDVPERIISDRLELRAVTAGVGEIVNAAIVESEKELARFMPWAIPCPQVRDTEEWCRQAHAKFIRREQLHYHFYLKSTGEFVGSVGLFNIDWNVPRGEIGYWLRTSQQGKGYMTEAVKGLVRVAFQELGFERLEIRCDDANPRSGAVAERCGFTLDVFLRRFARDNNGALRDDRLYSLLRSR